jgi:hypothetical protein
MESAELYEPCCALSDGVEQSLYLFKLHGRDVTPTAAVYRQSGRALELHSGSARSEIYRRLTKSFVAFLAVCIVY